MALRTQESIDSIVLLSKQNCFAKSMTYAANLSVGVAVMQPAKMQEVLIWATESDYSTLVQRNLYCDILLGNNMASAVVSALGQNNLFSAGF